MKDPKKEEVAKLKNQLREALKINGELQKELDEARRKADKFYAESRFDSLTGLPNRLALGERINEIMQNQALEDNSINFLCLLFADLDGFKKLNDTLGHAFGDEVLKSFAERLREIKREGDILSRLSGDEFVIAIPLVCDETSDIKERFQISLSQMFLKIGTEEIELRASVGMHVVEIDDYFNLGIELDKADEKMYEEKRRRGAAR